ncbi:MAG: NAD(P)-dependent oxidoreductase, partial [Candidatus Paceibacterota bacterium]
MARIAIVGAKGYVGGALSAALARDASYTAVRVTRDNYTEMQKGEYDILVNCAMPSGRFFAKNNPEQDFIETVKKTGDLLYEWKFKKFVQISTVSARCQLDTVYGRHKAAAEKLCDFGDNLIVRLGAMYSPDLAKGVLVDMMQGKKVFVDGESRYCFT